VFNQTLNIGAGPTSQGAFTGVFQNRFNPSVNATWMVGKHTLSFGGNYAYTQLNTRDERTNKGMVASVDLYEFVQGLVSPYENFVATAYLKGDANRYYWANQAGPYIQDKYQIRPNLTVTVGLRWDWNAGLAEKRGRIFNFDPTQYAFDQTTGVVTSNGLIVAGNNNQAATPGVSNTTLTGRQWGFAPRLGIAWSPSSFVLRSRRTVFVFVSCLCRRTRGFRAVWCESGSSVCGEPGLHGAHRKISGFLQYLRSQFAHRRFALRSVGHSSSPQSNRQSGGHQQISANGEPDRARRAAFFTGSLRSPQQAPLHH
jgi:hypothetical protein